jgi:hypothetical protein
MSVESPLGRPESPVKVLVRAVGPEDRRGTNAWILSAGVLLANRCESGSRVGQIQGGECGQGPHIPSLTGRFHQGHVFSFFPTTLALGDRKSIVLSAQARGLLQESR